MPLFGLKLVLGNMWLFKPLLKAVLPKISAQAGAMLQTTIAFTMQSGSDAYNVIPQEATLEPIWFYSPSGRKGKS